MTWKQAWAEAKRRWPAHAHISDRYWRGHESPDRFLVSDCGNIYGIGRTWEEAFAQADKRANEPSQ